MMKTPVKRALLSVSDKTGIVELARELHGRGVELLSTGGTYKLLKDSGLVASANLLISQAEGLKC